MPTTVPLRLLAQACSTPSPKQAQAACSTALDSADNASVILTATITIDCSNTTAAVGPVTINGSGIIVHIKGLTMFGLSAGITFQTGAALYVENCVFENITGIALDMEPSGALNLVVTNSRISNSGAGVFIKPSGSVTATFNGVTIVDNTGGGLKADATNGPISVDISNSTISNNSGNGLNAVSGALYFQTC